MSIKHVIRSIKSTSPKRLVATGSLTIVLALLLGTALSLNHSAAASLPAGNLLPNPGFEKWTNGSPNNWSKYSSTTQFTRTSPGRTGSYSTKITSTARYTSTAGINDGSTPTVTNTVVGATYSASCWVKVTRSMTVNAQLRELKQNGATVSSASMPLYISNTANWYQLTIKYTSKANGNKLPMSIFSNNTYNGGPAFLVDDCSLTVADTTAPSTPSGLKTNATTATGTGLSWNASTDNVGVNGYNVLRNGTVIATTTSASFADIGLTPGTTYSYSVVAFDAANNLSAATNAVDITTPFIPPSAPTNMAASSPSYKQVDLSWTAADPGSGTIIGYQISRNGSSLTTVDPTVTNYSDLAVNPDTAYSYSVVAVDSNQLSSPVSNIATVSTPALVPPTAPSNIQAITPSTTQVDLSWTAADPGDGALTGYQIKRNDSLLTTVSPDTTAYSDTAASPGTTYSYTISAIDSFNLTATSSPAKKTTPFTLEDWNTELAKVIHSDVTQSVTLPDGRILWAFGDTTQVNGISTVSYYGYPHSAFVTQEPDTLNFTPVTANYGYGWQPVPNWPDGTFFWMGTPIVDDGTLYVLGTRIKMNGSNFSVVGSYMASFDAQTLAYQSMIELPRGSSGSAVWNGITKTPQGWWITGTHRVDCYIINCFVGDVAFVPFDNLADTSSWQTTDDTIPSSSNIGDSLYPHYVGPNEWAIYTKIGSAYGGNTIGKFTAPSPTGPWTQTGSWATTNPPDTITYGAAIHPDQASPHGQLLLSYNVNGGPDDNYRAIFTYLP